MSFSSESIDKLQLLKSGNSVRVHFKIKEGEKTRIQVFEGVIISKHRKTTPDATITVRRMVKGQGVERIFPLYSPLIDKIEITKIANKIRRAKLAFLRERQGKSARLKETVLNDHIIVDLQDIFATEEALVTKNKKDVEKDGDISSSAGMTKVDVVEIDTNGNKDELPNENKSKSEEIVTKETSGKKSTEETKSEEKDK